MPGADLTLFPLTEIESLVRIIPQHLQFFFKQGSVLPCLEPNASCLDVTSLDLRVEPVFLTNWNSLFLLLDELLLEADCVSLPWKLIVRFRWGSCFWTTLTSQRSVSLPKLEITLIGSGVGASTVVVADLFFLSKIRSLVRTLAAMLSTIFFGYPDSKKACFKISSWIFRRSVELMILLRRRHCE